MNFVDDSDSPLITPLDNDSTISNSSSVEEVDFQVSQKVNEAKLDCKVILDDVFATDPTAKSKALKVNLEKTHSVLSRWSGDKNFLEQSVKRDPIAWPKMTDDESWAHLDSAVYSRLVGATLIQEKVEILENTIYDQACHLFGHPSPSSKKIFRGKNRRARLSISLCLEKNALESQITICVEPSQKSALSALLKTVKDKLRNIRPGERNRKKRWK